MVDEGNEVSGAGVSECEDEMRRNRRECYCYKLSQLAARSALSCSMMKSDER